MPWLRQALSQEWKRKNVNNGKKEISSILSGKQGSLFLILWIERDDFSQVSCQHLLPSCSCQPALSSKPGVKRERKKKPKRPPNYETLSCYSLLIKFWLQSLFLVSFTFQSPQVITLSMLSRVLVVTSGTGHCLHTPSWPAWEFQ